MVGYTSCGVIIKVNIKKTGPGPSVHPPPPTLYRTRQARRLISKLQTVCESICLCLCALPVHNLPDRSVRAVCVHMHVSVCVCSCMP